ncbi:hypothetical protein DFH09DRAFT_1216117 [Mycena vulgaris]|nr:hypothetical protein DFH09DRAFT_1216117 [Mycena vulgaris]
MASVLDSTYGIWLIALFLQTILYGMGMLQAYLYFFWYSADSWMVKNIVLAVIFLETFQLSALFGATYHYLISGFGNFPQLLEIHWLSLAQLLATYLSAFVVQSYFAYCIYALQKQDMILPLTILVSALVSLGAGAGQVVVAANIISYVELDKVKSTTAVNSTFSVLCDILITVGLSWRLNAARSGIQASNNLLNYLIVFAINRGMLTMITAILELVLFFAMPNTFYFFAMIWFTGKLYMNSMLATLNTRQHALRQQNLAEHMSMESVSVIQPRFNRGGPRVQGTVTTEDTGDRPSSDGMESSLPNLSRDGKFAL